MKPNGNKTPSTELEKSKLQKDGGSNTKSPEEVNDEMRGGPGRSKAGMKEGTLRYMLDVGRARNEQTIVDTYFKDEMEEYEVEEEVRNDRRR
jgi:hypothetical protein